MRSLALATVALATAATVAPAFAQPLDELVITGHGRHPPPVMSERVSFDDLDLRMSADRSILRHRVIRTAQRVCRFVGSPAPSLSTSPSEVARSCEGIAASNAMRQVRVAVNQAYARPAYAYNEWIGVRSGY